MYLQNSGELLHAFGNISSAGFISPTLLTDTKVGFSVQKDYPTSINYHPARTESGIADNVAAIWVVYESKAEKDGGELIPIRLRVANMSKFRAKHWDYDYEDSECPTESSIKESLNSRQPLELDAIGEFFYNAKTNSLVDSNLKEVSGTKILTYIFDAHCDSVQPIRGLKLRTVYNAHKAVRAGFDRAVDTLTWVLKHVFGRTLDERPNRMTYFHGYLPEDCKKLEAESIVVAGYRASKPIVFIFALIVALACVYLFPVGDHSYLSDLISSDYLLIVHSILLLVLLDVVLPHLIFRLLNQVIKWRWNYLDSRIKASMRL
jgi:hypothetical protein